MGGEVFTSPTSSLFTVCGSVTAMAIRNIKDKQALGPHRSPESPLPILRDSNFSLGMHFIFFCGHNKQFHVTCNGGRCLGTPKACNCDLEVGSSTVLEILGHFLSKGGTGYHVQFRMIMTTYHHMFVDTRNKNIYGLGVGISTVFEILGHFLFKGGRDHHERP
jgi:hypothetical protein